MEYSSLTPLSRGLLVPSPKSALVASANGNCLEVHCLQSNQLQHSTTTAGTVTHICWGIKSGREIIAAASIPYHCIVIIDALNGIVVADIHESPIPIHSIHLSQRGHLAILLQHSLGLSLVSIDQLSHKSFVPFVKTSHHLKFSPCSQYLALITNKDGIDGITVLHLDSGDPMMTIRGSKQLASINSITAVRWIPSSGGLFVHGSLFEPMHKTAFAIFSLAGKIIKSGDQLTQSDDDDVHGLTLLQKTYANVGLGIKTISINNDATLAAIACHDGNLILVNLISWTVVKVFPHSKPQISDDAPPTIFRERTHLVSVEETESDYEQNSEEEEHLYTENHPNIINEESCSNEAHRKRSKQSPSYTASNYFEALTTETEVEITKRMRFVSGANPNTATISHAEFSHDGSLIATKSDIANNVVFIWDVTELRLASVLALEDDVTSIRWGHAQTQLAIVCGGSYVYLWKSSGIAAIHLQADSRWKAQFCARKLVWASNDSALVVIDGISTKAFLTVYIE